MYMFLKLTSLLLLEFRTFLYIVNYFCLLLTPWLLIVIVKLFCFFCETNYLFKNHYVMSKIPGLLKKVFKSHVFGTASVVWNI